MKEAQELARHSDPKLTMNIYTKLGVHDLAGALDRLPRLMPPRPDRDALRATGTDDAAAFGHQQHTPQCARETAQMSATAHGEDGTGTLRFDSRKSSRGADMNDVAQTGAASGGKATQGTRTSGLKFTQAPVN